MGKGLSGELSFIGTGLVFPPLAALGLYILAMSPLVIGGGGHMNLGADPVGVGVHVSIGIISSLHSHLLKE